MGIFGPLSFQQLGDGDDLHPRVAGTSQGVLVGARVVRDFYHPLLRRRHADEDAHVSLVLVDGSHQLLHHGGVDLPASLDGDDGPARFRVADRQPDYAVDPLVADLFLIRLSVDQRYGPSLEVKGVGRRMGASVASRASAVSASSRSRASVSAALRAAAAAASHGSAAGS